MVTVIIITLHTGRMRHAKWETKEGCKVWKCPSNLTFDMEFLTLPSFGTGGG